MARLQCKDKKERLARTRVSNDCGLVTEHVPKMRIPHLTQSHHHIFLSLLSTYSSPHILRSRKLTFAAVRIGTTPLGELE
jgi:hypothetical protein